MKTITQIVFIFILLLTGSSYTLADMKLSSPAFKHLTHSQSSEGRYTPADSDKACYIPVQHSCKGSDISPELKIESVPANAKSLVLIVDDPDAPSGTFVHWVVWNIPPDTKIINKGQSPHGVQGMTDFRKRSYGGPCPPSGIHRYFFKLYALDTLLNINNNSTKHDVEHSMKVHVIDKTELIGLFKK